MLEGRPFDLDVQTDCVPTGLRLRHLTELTRLVLDGYELLLLRRL